MFSSIYIGAALISYWIGLLSLLIYYVAYAVVAELLVIFANLSKDIGKSESLSDSLSF
jgi:hypothetical protein